MALWVSADDILQHSGAYKDPATASTRDRTWAQVCSDAVNAGIDQRLTGATYAGLPAELVFAARGAGVEAYKRREATFGLTGYVDLQGAAIRISRDYLNAIEPILVRYATPGIG